MRTRFVSGLCHMRQRIERGNHSRVYVHASVLWHIYTHMFCCIMEDAEADEHSEESAGDEDHEDNEKPKKNVKVVGA